MLEFDPGKRVLVETIKSLFCLLRTKRSQSNAISCITLADANCLMLNHKSDVLAWITAPKTATLQSRLISWI